MSCSFRCHGFTLIEMLVALSLLALMLCFSFPMWSVIQARHQCERIGADVRQALQYARLYAVLQQSTVWLKPESASWSNGIQLWQEMRDNQLVLLWSCHWGYPQVRVSWHGFLSKEGIKIEADITHLAMNGYFLMETPRWSSEKIVINRLGRVRVV